MQKIFALRIGLQHTEPFVYSKKMSKGLKKYGVNFHKQQTANFKNEIDLNVMLAKYGLLFFWKEN